MLFELLVASFYNFVKNGVINEYTWVIVEKIKRINMFIK